MRRAHVHRVERPLRRAGDNDACQDRGNRGPAQGSHPGSWLRAELADRITLTAGVSVALAGLGKPRARPDPGQMLVDRTVPVADSATTISDIAVLALRTELGAARVLPCRTCKVPVRLKAVTSADSLVVRTTSTASCETARLEPAAPLEDDVQHG